MMISKLPILLGLPLGKSSNPGLQSLHHGWRNFTIFPLPLLAWACERLMCHRQNPWFSKRITTSPNFVKPFGGTSFQLKVSLIWVFRHTPPSVFINFIRAAAQVFEFLCVTSNHTVCCRSGAAQCTQVPISIAITLKSDVIRSKILTRMATPMNPAIPAWHEVLMSALYIIQPTHNVRPTQRQRFVVRRNHYSEDPWMFRPACIIVMSITWW